MNLEEKYCSGSYAYIIHIARYHGENKYYADESIKDKKNRKIFCESH